VNEDVRDIYTVILLLMDGNGGYHVCIECFSNRMRGLGILPSINRRITKDGVCLIHAGYVFNYQAAK